mmetsp:Transcript_63083/g.137081  ORF Transcript_63083/g.137081 Transcript_63083/m.137081 type:complete len:470 (-) Transcript_63083:141-1550(-)
MTEADSMQQMGQMQDVFDPMKMQQMQAMLMEAGATGPAPDPSYGGPSMLDPAFAQAYMQMFQYLQQGLQQPSLSGLPSMPSLPFPGMSPYGTNFPSEPTISVSVEGMKFHYQLTEDDLQKVFMRYGQVRSIRVDEPESGAHITFVNMQDAQAAMNDLNGKLLNGIEGTLRIQWAATQPTYPQVPFPPFGFPPASAPAWQSLVPGSIPGVQSAPQPAAADKAMQSKGVRKYTCRFLIGIDNDKDFQVARRIIGAKGANMKRIVRLTEAKLRLRGLGSGYFEGTGQKESNEPLQLCVSCTNAEGYQTAVQQVEELLKRVYEEYGQFCRESGRPVPDLSINLSENQLVYSSRMPAVVSRGMSGGLAEPSLLDGTGSAEIKEKSKRSRRSRGRGRETKSVNGEIERGEPGPNAPAVEEIEKFIDDRNEARRACNFPEADNIRKMLHARGVALMDEPGGRGRGVEVTNWRYWRD